MKVDDFISFIERNGFKKNTRDGSYIKTIKGMQKRYLISDYTVYLDTRPNSSSDYKMIAFADIRHIHITDNDKLGGFERYINTRS